MIATFIDRELRILSINQLVNIPTHSISSLRPIKTSIETILRCHYIALPFFLYSKPPKSISTESYDITWYWLTLLFWLSWG